MEWQRFLRTLSKKSQKFMEHICVTCFDFWEYSRSFESQWNNVIPAKVEEEWFCNEYKTRRDHPRTFRRQLISRLREEWKIFLLMYTVRFFSFVRGFCLKIFRAPRVNAFIIYFTKMSQAKIICLRQVYLYSVWGKRHSIIYMCL